MAITCTIAAKALVLADGHHRYATALAIGEEFEAEAKERGLETSDGLLEYVLGITPEAQTQKANLKYLHEAAMGVASLESGEGQVLFLMSRTPVSIVRRVAEAGEVMPQKSTFFYPSVPAGRCSRTLYLDRLIP